MATAISVLNQGLAKLSSAAVATITPPRTSLERFCAENYVQWRRSEIAKHPWRFALTTVTLTQTGDVLPSAHGAKLYQYLLPNDCVRVRRRDGDEWEQYGRMLRSGKTTGLTVEYLADKGENEMDPLFIDVLACRVAIECVEKVTQSNTKRETIEREYERREGDAKKNNAFVTGPVDIQDDDSQYSWLSARWGDHIA